MLNGKPTIDPGGPSRAAYTLVELLVVVLIIAILAAIAVPNFLVAQTRANICRARTELRLLQLAITAYYTEQDRFPPAADESSRPIVPYPPVGLGPEFSKTHVPPNLTTPVAYLTVLPADPFAAKRPDEDLSPFFEGNTYHYTTSEYALINEGAEGHEKFRLITGLALGNELHVLYYVASHGPDLDHDDDEDPADVEAAAPYDPTNGVASSGDLFSFGPGFGGMY